MMKRLLTVATIVLLAAGSASAQSLNLPAKSLRTTTASNGLVVVPATSLLGLLVTADLPNGGYAMAFDATSIPADGPVNPNLCIAIPPPVAPLPSSSASMANTPTTVALLNGAVVVISTTGCYTLTKVATNGFIEIAYQ